jgi:hypothetical protein
MAGPRWRIVACCIVTLIALPLVAAAESLLPLSAQQVTTLPSGRAEAILSIGYTDALWFPPFTEPGQVSDQTLMALPTFGFNIGLGDRVEVQASYELLLLQETQLGEGDVTNYGSGDARLFTKVRAWSEDGWRPAFGLRFGAKLPNGNASDHLGTDQVDWGGELLGSKTLGPVDLLMNMGLQILDNPNGAGQDDLFSWGVAVTSRDLVSEESAGFGLRLVAEAAGLTGSRFGNDRAALRGGFQIRRAPLTFFGGVSTGLIRESENIGGLLGVIWTFQTFE